MYGRISLNSLLMHIINPYDTEKLNINPWTNYILFNRYSWKLYQTFISKSLWLTLNFTDLIRPDKQRITLSNDRFTCSGIYRHVSWWRQTPPCVSREFDRQTAQR